MRYRKQPFSPFGPYALTTFQDFFELAENYDECGTRLVFSPVENPKAGLSVATLRELEEDGYINMVLAPRDDDPHSLTLEKLRLTLKGHEHLSALRERGVFGAMKRRAGDLFWMVPATIVTTLLTIELNSCIGR